MRDPQLRDEGQAAGVDDGRWDTNTSSADHTGVRAPDRHDTQTSVQRLLDRVLRPYSKGTLRICVAGGGEYRVGRGTPQAAILVQDRRALLWMLVNPPLRFGEGYMTGLWTPHGCTLTDVLTVVIRNLNVEAPARWRRVLKRRLYGLGLLNDPERSRRNAAHHYDLPFSLYRDFLDPDLHYSCAYYRDEGFDLAQAQQAKCAHIAAKLDLRPGARVLDIGCGWGSLALYLAANHDVHVLGITLSREQLAVARQRAKVRGLTDRVAFELLDYREVSDSFNAVVSVGMFEHVGRADHPRFFEDVRDALQPHGTALVHTIARQAPPERANAWVRRYIFPGGHLPSLSEIARPIEDSGLLLTDLEVWRLHYARTLAHWNERFQRVRERHVVDRGERFCRMWEFYLQASEASFRSGRLAVFQLQLVRDQQRLPLTREYMYR